MMMRTLCCVALVGACATSPDRLATVITPALFTADIEVGREGEVAEGDVLTVGSLRPHAVIRTQAAFKGPVRSYEAGHPFAASVQSAERPRAVLPGDRADVVWCDFDTPPTFGTPVRTCFADADGDGRFEAAVTTHPGDVGPVYGRFRAYKSGWSGDVPFATGKPEAVHVRKVGYRVCSTGGTPRFASVVAREKGGFPEAYVACNFGERAADGTITADRIAMKAEASGDRLAYEIVSVPQDGPVSMRDDGAALLAADASPLSKGTAERALLDALASAAITSAEVVSLSGVPARLERGDVFLSVPARHGVTARLAEPFAFKRPVALGWLGSSATELEAGTPLYGVMFGSLFSLLSSPDSVNTTWCALERSAPDAPYASLCFPTASGGGTYHEAETRTLLATRLGGNGSVHDAAPVVVRERVSLVPMTATYALGRVRRDEVQVTITLRTEDGQEQRLLRGLPIEDGAAVLPLGEDASITFSAAGDGAVEASVTGDVVPADARVY